LSITKIFKRLLEFANENPYLAQMLEEKKQQAVDNLVEISNTPEQVFVATGSEYSDVVLQGAESGIFDH
jgi:hypothetical protein